MGVAALLATPLPSFSSQLFITAWLKLSLNIFAGGLTNEIPRFWDQMLIPFDLALCSMPDDWNPSSLLWDRSLRCASNLADPDLGLRD